VSSKVLHVWKNESEEHVAEEKTPEAPPERERILRRLRRSLTHQGEVMSLLNWNGARP
jgi:uncharacterized protein (DUF2126 family)